MNRPNLLAAIAAAEAFIDQANRTIARQDELDALDNACRASRKLDPATPTDELRRTGQTGDLRRRSMDLTRSLAQLRKPG